MTFLILISPLLGSTCQRLERHGCVLPGHAGGRAGGWTGGCTGGWTGGRTGGRTSRRSSHSSAGRPPQPWPSPPAGTEAPEPSSACKGKKSNRTMLQRAGGSRVHLILPPKHTFHRVTTLLTLITYFSKKSTPKIIRSFDFRSWVDSPTSTVPVLVPSCHTGAGTREMGQLKLPISHPPPPLVIQYW